MEPKLQRPFAFFGVCMALLRSFGTGLNPVKMVFRGYYYFIVLLDKRLILYLRVFFTFACY